MAKKRAGGSGSVKKPNHRKSTTRVYANLAQRRRVKVDKKSRQKAEYLATLPKSRLKRIGQKLNPRRLVEYWFSKEGALMALKIAGIGLALFVILILSIFAIYRKDLAISPDELARRVQSRTTQFYDRTGQVLLYDLYKDQQLTFVKPDQISNNMKYAMVAIEDKDFYKHGGFDIKGILRSVLNNASGGGKQGASTLTQQLARVVILRDNTATGISGYTRKIKELIVSIELERTYSKDEILNFYLNSVSFGGTAVGVESAAQRYFNKPASKLTIDEAAYIASIPQFPSLYDKNNPGFDADAAVARQQTVIKYMQEQGYITKAQADKAKKVDILAKIKPLKNQQNIKAPHFVNEIIKELEAKYGADNVRQGGWRIITTIDWNAQKLAEKAIKDNIANVEAHNGDNAALVAIDVKTNQVLAMAGSRDYNYKGYGETNAATANLQYGSSMKPFVYGELFDQGSYGPGSIIPDTPQVFNGRQASNFDNRYRGNIPIRSSLAESRNLPAMKAASFAGMDKVIETVKKAGETNILCVGQNKCTEGYASDPFMAIGTGTVHLDQHTAAYATIARGYVAKPEVKILKIEKQNGDVVEEWKDTPGKQIYEDQNHGDQIRYLLSSILSDDVARAPTFGYGNSYFNIPGVKMAVKTGTTDNQKDGWMMGYSTGLAVGVWAGNHDGTPMYTHTDLSTGPIFGQFSRDVHQQVMTKPQYGWKLNDWFSQPAGIQRLSIGGRTDIFQSWFRRPKETKKKYTMDKLSKKLATSCTPAGAKEEIEVSIISDPNRRGSEVVGPTPAGYDIKNSDDIHKCSDKKPSVASFSSTTDGSFTVTISKGKFQVTSVEFMVDGKSVKASHTGGNTYTGKYTQTGNHTVTINITDAGYYESTDSRILQVS
jgi:penicillin-binding protein 1A